MATAVYKCTGANVIANGTVSLSNWKTTDSGIIGGVNSSGNISVNNTFDSIRGTVRTGSGTYAYFTVATPSYTNGGLLKNPPYVYICAGSSAYTSLNDLYKNNVTGIRLILSHAYQDGGTADIASQSGSITYNTAFDYYNYSVTLHKGDNCKSVTGSTSGDTVRGGTTHRVTATGNSGTRFLGWYDGSGNRVSSSTSYNVTVNRDVELTARFVKVYTVKFKDWQGKTIKSQNVDEGGSATAPNHSIRDGYTFAGWSDDFSDVRSDLTITEIWSELHSHSISYDSNGGSPTPGRQTSGETVDTTWSFVLQSAPIKTGHTFAGWMIGNSTYEAGQTVSVSGAVTAVAQWTANEYTVSFSANGGAPGGPSSITVTYGKNVPDLPGFVPPTPANTWEKFDGYFDSQTGGTRYWYSNGLGAETWDKTIDNLTFYARWDDTRTATLKIACGDHVTKVYYKVNGAASWSYVTGKEFATIKVVPESRWYAYAETEFGYTAYQKEGGAYYRGYTEDFSETLKTPTGTKSKSITFKAFANDCTIWFSKNDGSASEMPSQIVYYGDASTLNANSFTRTGYTFTGWNTERDGTGVSYDDKQAVTDIVTFEQTSSAIILYAQWAGNEYEITFDNNFQFLRWAKSNRAKTNNSMGTLSIDVYAGSLTIRTGPDDNGGGNDVNTHTLYDKSAPLSVPVGRTTGEVTKYSVMANVTRVKNAGAGATANGGAQIYVVFYDENGTILRYDKDGNPRTGSIDYTGLATVRDEDGRQKAYVDYFVCPAECKYIELFFDEHAAHHTTTFTDIFLVASWRMPYIGQLPARMMFRYSSDGSYGSADVFNGNGNVIGGRSLLPEEPNFPGRDFSHWHIGAERISGDTPLKTAHCIIFSEWSVKQVSLTFDPNGGAFSDTGSSDVRVSTQSAGGKISLPEVERSGYKFKAWRYRAADGNDYDVGGTVPNEDTAYAASWRKVVEIETGFDTTENDGTRIARVYSMLDGRSVSLTGDGDQIESNRRTILAPTVDGLEFVKWSGLDGEPTDNPHEFSIPGYNLDIKAVYRLKEVQVEAEVDVGSSGAGTAYASPASGHVYGDSVTFSATPNEGFVFSGWYEGDILKSTDGTYVVQSIEDDFSLKARFAIRVSVATDPLDMDPIQTDGHIAPSPGDFGAEVVEHVGPADGWYELGRKFSIRAKEPEYEGEAGEGEIRWYFAGWYAKSDGDGEYRPLGVANNLFEFTPTSTVKPWKFYAAGYMRSQKTALILVRDVVRDGDTGSPGMTRLVSSGAVSVALADSDDEQEWSSKYSDELSGHTLYKVTGTSGLLTAGAYKTSGSTLELLDLKHVAPHPTGMSYGSDVVSGSETPEGEITLAPGNDRVVTAIWGIPESRHVSAESEDGAKGVASFEIVDDNVSPDAEGRLSYGTEVDFFATPMNGYRFSHWTNDATGSVVDGGAAVRLVVRESDLHMVAHFADDAENAIYEWEGGSDKKDMLWHSGVIELPRPFDPVAARVDAMGYPIELDVITKSAPNDVSRSQRHVIHIDSQDGRRLPRRRPERFMEIEVIAASEVDAIVVSSNMAEAN